MTVLDTKNHQMAYYVGTANEKIWVDDSNIKSLLSLGLFDIVISNSAPAITQLWYDPSDTNTTAGQLKIWDGVAWVNCTPALLKAHLAGSNGMALVGVVAVSYSPTSGPFATHIVGPLTWDGLGTITVSSPDATATYVAISSDAPAGLAGTPIGTVGGHTYYGGATGATTMQWKFPGMTINFGVSGTTLIFKLK